MIWKDLDDFENFDDRVGSDEFGDMNELDMNEETLNLGGVYFRGGNWLGWVVFELDHKWAGLMIIHLYIYNPYKFKLNINYPSNPL